MKKTKLGNKHKVPVIKGRIRISDYCGNIFPILGSKSATKKALAKNNILLNGRVAKTSDLVKTGDFIELKQSNTRAIKKLDVAVDIVFEDEFIVIVNKPGGIAVNGNRFKTVENAVANLNKNNKQPDALPRPVAVHRIDVPTKGMVILAKTKGALINMSRLFQENKVSKKYVAIVHGKVDEKGEIDQPIGGKKSRTNYQTKRVVPSRVYDHLSLVELHPITGRTHQLRIHMKDLGHLILGDKEYAINEKTLLGKGLFLCACSLKFPHPISGKPKDFQISPPTRFTRILDREAQRFK